MGFSPDGKRLACTYSPVDDDPIKDSSRSIRIWDLATRQAVVTIDRLPSRFGAGTSARTAGSWSPPPGRWLSSRCGMRRPAARPSLATSPTEGSCGTRPSARTASVWPPALTRRFASGTWPAARRRPPGRPIPRAAQALAFSPDGNRLATGGARDGRAVGHRDRSEGPDLQGALRTRRRDGLQSGRHAAGHGGLRRHPAPLGRDRAAGLCFHPQRRGDARGRTPAQPRRRDGIDGSPIGPCRALRLWDTATGQPRCGPIELPQAVVSQAAWTADGRHLYVADAGKTMRVVDVASGEVVRTFPIDAETKSTTASPSVPMRDGAPTPGPVARSRCGRPGPEPSSARSGNSKGPTCTWRSVRTARA